jgi:rhodanese-related sulfurtransferase
MADQEAITPQVLLGQLNSGMGLVPIDVRESDEYSSGHLPSAINLPFTALSHNSASARRALASLHAAPLVTYCACPYDTASKAAIPLLQAAGAHSVRFLKGGVTGWVIVGGSLTPKGR